MSQSSQCSSRTRRLQERVFEDSELEERKVNGIYYWITEKENGEKDRYLQNVIIIEPIYNRHRDKK